MPKILNEDGTLMEYASWSELFKHQTTLGPQIIYVYDKLDITFLNGVIDALIGIQVDMDTFVKEARVVIDARYNAYNTKVHKLLDMDWPTEDEYKEWLEKYVE